MSSKRRSGDEGHARSTHHKSSMGTSAINAAAAKLLSTSGTNFVGLELERTVPIFPLIAEMTNDYDPWMVKLHVIIDIVQLLALGLLPYHTHWSFSLEGIAKALFFTHLPVFDPNHLRGEMLVSVIIASIFFAGLFVLYGFGALFVYVGDEDLIDAYVGAKTYKNLGHLLSLFGTVAFVPVLQNFVALAYCKPPDASTDGESTPMLWFTEFTCGEGAGAYGLILATIGVILLLGVAYVVNSWMFTIDPMSRHLQARANATLDSWYMAFRLISVILMHHFVSKPSQLVYFAVWMAIWPLLLGIAYCYFMPYYRKSGQQTRVASLFLCSLLAVISAISYAPSVADAFARFHLDTIIVGAAAPVFAWLFSRVALWRTSSVFLKGMRELNEGIVNFDSNFFCRGLPENDLIFPEAEIADLFKKTPREDNEDENDGDDGGRGDKDSDEEADEEDFNFTLPYIDEVSCAEDVELAARFLIFARKCTMKPPTRHQLAFAARLFGKGLTLFRDSPILRLGFALFLTAHADQPRAAQKAFSALKQLESPLWVRYQAFREQQRLGSMLSSKSSSRLAAFARARKRHHDALQATVDFWQLLLNDDTDKEALSTTTRNILAAKKEVLAAYVRLLERHPSSMELVASYSVFCETVLDDSDATMACNQYLSELRDMRQSSAMRGAKARAAKQNDTVAQLPLELDDNDELDSNTSETKNAVFLQRSRYVLLLIVLFITGVAVAIVVEYQVANGVSRNQLVGAFRSGTMRALAGQAAVAVDRYVHAARTNVSEAVIAPLRAQLLGIQQDFHALHNSLTYSDYRPTSEEHRDFFRNPGLLEFDGSSVGFWTLGTLVIVALRDIYERPLHSEHVEWAIEKLPTSVAIALNNSATLYHEGFAARQLEKEVVTIAVGLAGLASLAVLVLVATYNSSMIASARSDIFSLFTLIPRDVIKRMVKANKKKLASVTEFFAMKTKEKIFSRIGAGDDEKQDLQLHFRGPRVGGGDNDADDSDADSARKSSTAGSVSKLESSQVSTSSRLSHTQLGALAGRGAGSGGRGKDDSMTLERNMYGESSAAAIVRVTFGVAVAVVILVAAVMLMEIPKKRDALRRDNVQLARFIGELSTDVTRRVEELGFTIGHPRHNHLTTYQNLRVLAKWGDVERLLLASDASVAEMQQFRHAHTLNAALEEVEDMVLRLATPSIPEVAIGGRRELNLTYVRATAMAWLADARNLKIQGIRSEIPDFDVDDLAGLPPASELFDPLDPVAVAAGYNATYLLQWSRRILYSRTVYGLTQRVSQTLRTLRPAAFPAMMSEKKEQQLAFLGVGLGLAAILIFSASHHLVEIMRRHASSRKRDAVFTTGTIIFAAVVLALSAAELSEFTDFRKVGFVTKLDAARDLHFGWTEELSTFIRLSESYLNSDGDLYWLLRFRDAFKQGDGTDSSSLSQGANHAMPGPRYPSTISDSVTTFEHYSSQAVRAVAESRAAVLLKLLSDIKLMYEVAIALAYYARTPFQDVINATFIDGITWNISREENFRTITATYADFDSMLYTNRVDDLQLNATEKLRLSRNVAISIRLGSATTAAINTMNELLSRILADVEQVEDDFAKRQANVYVILLVMAAIALGCACLSALDVFIRVSTSTAMLKTAGRHSRHSSAASGRASGSAKGSGSTGGSGSAGYDSAGDALVSAKSGPYFAAATFAVLLVTLMVLAGVEVLTTAAAPLRIDRATQRSLIVARSMLAAQRMQQPEHYIEGVVALTAVQEELRALVTALYFDSGGGFFGVGVDAVQDRLLFDRGDIAASNFFTPCNSTYATMVQQQLVLGTGLLFEDAWLQAVKTVVLASPSTLPTALAQLQALYDVVIVGLTASSERFLAFEHDQSNKWESAFIAIGAIMAALAFLSSFVVVGPYINHLAREESSARLMLKIIPEDAIQRNSQIASYLEFGSVDTSTDADGINDAIASMSSVPVIAIDFRGIIMRFTPAAEQVFGYATSEVVGSNIKLLMPKDVAEHHDSYLANYRRTRVRHVVDSTRRVVGIRKDSTQVPLDLSVQELRFSEEDSVFIAFLRDVTSELELAMQDKLNRYITDMSQDPIISIDHMGVILSVNNATTQVFGYSKEELLRENVKMLMPSEIALNHDGYLQRYRETGVKRVVDSTRRVQAQRKSGEIFQVTITVREIKGDMGQPPTFIGFVVDVTSEHLAATQNALNDIISDLSPVPIIAINHTGAFIKFSRAAAELFGHNRDDLIMRGRNVQILVPPKYGNHDAYLKRYFDTGVKTVVDVTRNISCLKRDGSEFPAELTVREIKKQGMQPVFLAYLVDITQTLKVHEEARVTNTIVEFSMIPVVATDTSGIITLFNDAAETTFGFRRDEVIGQNVSILMPAHIGRQHDGFMSAYLRTREKHVVDSTRSLTARRKDGSTFAAELTLKEVEESAKGPGSFFAYIRDVTQHRQTLQQFMINDAISSLSTIPIVGINAKGTIEAFSPAAEACFGYTASEMLGENVKILMPPEVSAQHDDYLKAYHKTGVKHIIDAARLVTGVRKSGQTFSLEISVREIKKEGQQSSFVGYLRDTSQDKALEDERNFGTTIRDLSPIPIVQTDKFGILTYVNQAMLTEWGYVRDEVVGQNVKMIMPDNLAESHDDHVTRFREDPSGSQHSTVVGKVRRLLGKRRDGSIFEVEAKIQCVQSPRSDMFILVGFLRNLATQLKLEEANYTIDTLSNLSTVPIIAIDHRGVVIKFSNAAEKAWGYSHREVEGQNVKMLMPENIAEKHDSYLKMYLKTGVRVVVDNILRQEARHKNGSLFPVELAIKEIRKAGQDSLFIGYVRDASQDTALERAMTEAKTVTEANPIAIVVANRRGIVLTFNDAASQLFDYTREEVVGNNVSMLMMPDDAKFHDKYLKLYAKNRIKNAIDAAKVRHARHKDGSSFPVEITVREIIPASGDLTQTKYLSFIKDLTSMRVLHQAGMINDAIASITSIPLIAITAKGVILRFSESAEECFGYRATEVIGKNVSMLMPSQIAQQHDGFLSRYFTRNTSNEASFERRVTALRRSGETFPAKLSVREVRKAGQESMFVGYLEDMTSKFNSQLQKRIADTAVQLTTVPIVMIEPSGTIVEFNAAAEECFGYIRRDVIGHNVSLLMPKKVAEMHDGFLANYLTTGVQTVINNVRNVMGKRRDGRKFPLEISVREMKDDTHHHFIGYLRDTSNFYALKEAAAINDAIVMVSPSPLIIINEACVVQVFSPAAESAFGYVATEVVGKNVSMLMPARWADQHDNFVSRYVKTREARVVGKKTKNLRGLRKDGTEFPIELHIGEVTVDGTSQFVGIVRDITEEARLELEAAMGSASESMTTKPILAIDDHGVIVKANRSSCEIFGYVVDELVGNNIKMLMPAEVAAMHDGYLQRYRETGVKTVVDSERSVIAVTKTGAHKPVVLKVREIVTSKGSVFVGHVADEQLTKRYGYSAGLASTLAALIPIPIVAIDSKGTVLSFNQAAEKVFEFAAAQVIGKNVSILMPEDTQRNHDGYLEAYARTGEKHVIDNRRRVVGETKSGKRINVEISVKEVRNGASQMFIGYLKPV